MRVGPFHVLHYYLITDTSSDIISNLYCVEYSTFIHMCTCHTKMRQIMTVSLYPWLQILKKESEFQPAILVVN